jgi:K+-sensing histidine kinase KdpD
VLVAVASAAMGFAADVWPIDARPVYAMAKVGLRLVLFTAGVLMCAGLEEASRREQELAEREHESAVHVAELNRLRGELMRSVVRDVQAPLADIYARVVTLGFEVSSLSEGEVLDGLGEIAEASRRLSDTVNRLLEEEGSAQREDLIDANPRA